MSLQRNLRWREAAASQLTLWLYATGVSCRAEIGTVCLTGWQPGLREWGGPCWYLMFFCFFFLSFLCGMFIKDLGWSREKVACSLGLPHVLFHYWFYLLFSFFSYFCAVHLISGVWREGLVLQFEARGYGAAGGGGGDRSMVDGVSFQLTSKLSFCCF